MILKVKMPLLPEPALDSARCSVNIFVGPFLHPNGERQVEVLGPISPQTHLKLFMRVCGPQTEVICWIHLSHYC